MASNSGVSTVGGGPFRQGEFALAVILHLDTACEIDVDGYPKADCTRLYEVEGKSRPVLVVGVIGECRPREYIVLKCTSVDKRSDAGAYWDAGRPLAADKQTWVRVIERVNLPPILVRPLYHTANGLPARKHLNPLAMRELMKKVVEADPGAAFLARHSDIAAVRPSFTVPASAQAGPQPVSANLNAAASRTAGP